ncbi:hypothetical protein [Thermoactinomyces sp. DSM 45892]|uniref:hypothetical protein n=1 Tax=Thermoactinomyces sp. DSM 45892 TaxID=1882753 RepID=UPI0008989710|nr:hypothetical protein [Thermoactinomyces sp. DSM 45892]SDY88913.1 hypothetical protein SAMN05444416_109180 [Thermoactinomyces sp. DSM 45892]
MRKNEHVKLYTYGTYGFERQIIIQRSDLRNLMDQRGWKEDIDTFFDEYDWDNSKTILEDALRKGISVEIHSDFRSVVTRTKKVTDSDCNVIGKIRDYYLISDEPIQLCTGEMEAIMDALDEMPNKEDTTEWEPEGGGYLLLVHPDYYQEI